MRKTAPNPSVLFIFQILQRINVHFIRYPAPRGRTKTGHAIEYTEQLLFSKSKHTRKEELIVITDGESTDDVRGPAQHLKQMGVDVVSVGVGHSFKKSELVEIASTEEEVFEIDFDHLQQLVGKILRQACKPPGI